MGKFKIQRQTWILHGGNWYNFHEYEYYRGDVIFVVRGPCKKKGDFTRKVATKFVKPARGEYRGIKKDECWKDENPDDFKAWRGLMNVWRNYHGNV